MEHTMQLLLAPLNKPVPWPFQGFRHSTGYMEELIRPGRALQLNRPAKIGREPMQPADKLEAVKALVADCKGGNDATAGLARACWPVLLRGSGVHLLRGRWESRFCRPHGSKTCG